MKKLSLLLRCMKRREMKLLKAPVVPDKAVRAGPSSYPPYLEQEMTES